MSLYPITIYKDRYSGCYAGGDWIAVLGGDRAEDALDALADNVTADHFWDKHKNATWIAVGDTPDGALRNLEEKNVETLREQEKRYAEAKRIGWRAVLAATAAD